MTAGQERIAGRPRVSPRRAAAAASPAPIAVSHGRRDFVIRRSLAVSDAFGILGAACVAFVVSPLPDRLDMLPLVLPLLPLWMLLFRAYGLYDRDVKRISHPVLDEMPGLFHAFLIGSLAMWIYMRVLPVRQMAFIEVLVFGLVGLALVPLLRSITRRLVDRAFGPERVLVVGGELHTRYLLDKMTSHPEYALEPVGLVQVGDGGRDPTLEIVGRISASSLKGFDLESIVDSERVERLIVAAEDVDDEVLLALLREAGRFSLKVGILPGYLEALGPSLQVDEIEGLTVLGVNPPVLPRYARALKRALDLAVAVPALLLSAPGWALIAIAIKVESRGPVLFRQRRVGRRGDCFMLIKFRTMVADAEERLEDLKAESSDPHWVKVERDPRVTRVGRLLRLTSLDELPQLWNVLRGEMSLVGPRPLVEPEDEQVTGWDRTRLDLAPGLTGLWQVLGRTRIPFEEMVKLDYLYVTNWSLWTDVKLILRTIPVVLRRTGAN